MKKLPWLLLSFATLIIAFLLYLLHSLNGLNYSIMSDFGYNSNGILTKEDREKFDLDLRNAFKNKARVAELSKLDFKPIDIIPAQKYHSTYLAKRRDLRIKANLPAMDTFGVDDVEAVIFELDSIILGAIKAFQINVDSFTIDDFRNKSLVLYFANYGGSPLVTDIGGTNTLHKNTLIAQYAHKAQPQDDWIIKTNNIYNFGGLKPKKPLLNDQIKPKLP
ncbi:MAG: hypothetical protein KA330_11890 [Chitinophagaceae bacterium]|nr:hypothetical protein [Chitinophagaceae bacterium]